MTLRFLSIEHIPQEGVGAISSYIRERGGHLARHRQYQGEPLSASHDDYDALVVMGGPMGASDGDRYAWLDQETRFIREAIDQGKRVLGVCLGAQLIAKALGAEVRKNHCAEIGWFPVRFEDSFRNAPPGRGLDRELEVLHWHGDTFETPSGATRVASSEACANQGFLFEGRALGLQFHLEMGMEEARVMTETFRDELKPRRFVQGEEEIKARAERNAATVRKALFSMLDGLLERLAPREATEV